MKLKRLTIENYKALGHVDIHVRNSLLFLIGVNGAGKSSVLQALSLVRYFADGATNGFFKDRGWSVADGRPKTAYVAPLRGANGTPRRSSARHLTITLALEHQERELLWTFQWSYATERTIAESFWIRRIGQRLPERILAFPDNDDDGNPVTGLFRMGQLRLPGSVLAIMRPESLSAGREGATLLRELKSWADGITSLELLNPAAMRSTFRGNGGDLGPQGERLASFLADLKPDAKDRVVRRIGTFYPIDDLDTTRKRTGWIDMKVSEAFKLMGRVDVAHMSDGFLRILALASIPEFGADASLVLLDEVEDGIEPHILPHLIERIAAESASQLVMTSHSPLLVNFFDRDQIYLLARDARGQTVGGEISTLEPFRGGDDYLGNGEIWANAAAESLYDSLPAFRMPRNSISDGPTARDVLRYLQD